MQFYKFKNGNSSFEFEVESRLCKIEKIISGKHSALLCGVFSGIIAFYIQEQYENYDGWKFIALLFVLYLALLFLMIGVKWVLNALFVDKYYYIPVWFIQRNILKTSSIDAKASEESQLETKALFWNKIVSVVVQAISLVNRLDDIETEHNGAKKDLKPIYAMQAEYLFEYASELLCQSKLKGFLRAYYVDAIGSDAINWLFKESLNCLKKLEEKLEAMDHDNLEYKDTRIRLKSTRDFYLEWQEKLTGITDEKSTENPDQGNGGKENQQAQIRKTKRSMPKR